MNDVLITLDNSTISSVRWRVEDIDFSALNRGMCGQDPAILWLAVASSSIESASDIYTKNLVEYFAAAAEISGWLLLQ